MDLTIREIAEQLEVSKNTVKYHMRKLDEELTEKDLTYKNGGMIYVRPEGITMIQESVQQVRSDEPEIVDDDTDDEEPVSKKEEPQKTTSSTSSESENSHIKDLQLQLEVLVKDKALKDEQLKAKDVQISELHRLLDQQQRLNLLAEAKIRQLEGRSDGTLQELLEEGVEENEAKNKAENQKPGTKTPHTVPSNPTKKEEPSTPSVEQKKWWQFWK